MADLNKKILLGDQYPKSIHEDIPPRVTIINPEPPAEGNFTFDRMDITFDSLVRTFDEL